MTEQGPLDEGRAHEGAGDTSDTSGSAGTPPPTTEHEAPDTDPELRDAGEPPGETADPEGTSGAEEGLNPWAPQAYEAEGEGPTTSTED